MKVSIKQKDLLDCLKVVVRAVSNQNTLPVLGNILIKAENKKIYFAATNLEISITTACEAEVFNEGSITIPAKILTSYTSLLGKNEEVELKITDGVTLEIKTESSNTKIKGISADEFPRIARVEGGQKLTVRSETFKDMVHQVGFAAQENSARPILSGVCFVANKDDLRMAATDSYRLSEKKVILENPIESLQCVIPVRAVYEADRLAGAADSVELVVSENQVMFSFGSTELVSRLIEGQFPDYQQIIPKNHQSEITIERSAFELAVRRVSIFAKENNQHMRLEVTGDGQLTIKTDSTQIGEEKTTIAVDLQGQPNAIALNADYVLDVLGSTSGEEKIRLFLEGKLNPAVFKKQNSDDYVHLIMPLKM